MRLISKLSALVAGLTLAAAPAFARVDAGTPSLIASLPRYGVNVALNHSDCNDGDRNFHGYYNTGTRAFVVCYSGTPGANDHDTVRHEAMHVAQHCVAQRSGHPYGIRTILTGEDLDQFVSSVLTPTQIEGIKGAYPSEVHDIELEAFAGAAHYSSAQVQSIVEAWCNYDWTVTECRPYLSRGEHDCL